MEKFDLNGYRKPEDVVRRYPLGNIELNSDDIEKLKQEVICDDHLSLTSKAPVQNKVVTAAIDNKVSKVSGKGLSTNDYTDSDKTKVASAITSIPNADAVNVGGLKVYLDSNNNLYITNNGDSPVPNP